MSRFGISITLGRHAPCSVDRKVVCFRSSSSSESNSCPIHHWLPPSPPEQRRAADELFWEVGRHTNRSVCLSSRKSIRLQGASHSWSCSQVISRWRQKLKCHNLTVFLQRSQCSQGRWKSFFSINAAVIWQYCNKGAGFSGRPFPNICKINYYYPVYNAVILRPILITDG